MSQEKPIYRLAKSYNGFWGVRWDGYPNYGFMPKHVTRDNQKAYNTKSGYGNRNSIRVPSLKRSDKVWRNFYNLFPQLKGQKTYRGCKLKKV